MYHLPEVRSAEVAGATDEQLKQWHANAGITAKGCGTWAQTERNEAAQLEYFNELWHRGIAPCDDSEPVEGEFNGAGAVS